MDACELINGEPMEGVRVGAMDGLIPATVAVNKVLVF